MHQFTLTFASLAAALVLSSVTQAEPARPNVVVIVCDDMGFSDIGCYGSEIDTPHLDALAAGGLRFTDFHNNAKCSETRASIMTGLWHQQSRNLRRPGHVTMAEVLRTAGYRTLMSGKWHLASTPPQRGFDRYFGFLSGAINFFTGRDWQTGENLMRLDEEVYEVPDDFYSTDAFTDYAIEFLKDSPDQDQPFFLYLAHNAPHFPLHALPEDIAKYKGRYQAGWDAIRARRYERLRELGVADETWRLSDRDPKVEPWNEITEEEADFLEPMMEVYAAMVDRLDQNIGRLVEHLRSTNQLDNTLILFFSDNGACPFKRIRAPYDDHGETILVPGAADSGIAYDARWANMCNTPLRLYKQYAHNGGTQTPMIAHWPAGIRHRGEFCGFTSHLVDLMPTLVQLSGAEYPEEVDGQAVAAMEGVSLVDAFQNPDAKRPDKPLFWEFNANHAVRDGRWQLVAERSGDWELYDLSKDHSETQNIAKQHPETVRRLAAKYDAWAERTGARLHQECHSLEPSTQGQLFDLQELVPRFHSDAE